MSNYERNLVNKIKTHALQDLQPSHIDQDQIANLQPQGFMPNLKKDYKKVVIHFLVSSKNVQL